MSSRFDGEQWSKIRATLDKDPTKYGIPQREYGSVVLASFNIRKLAAIDKRRQETWDFLSYVCQHFDLLAIQEIMDDLEGFKFLAHKMGSEYGTVVSDQTGVFPGERGLGERLGFIYNRNLIWRDDVVSDVTYDRSKLLHTIAQHHEELYESLAPYAAYLDKLNDYAEGRRSTKPDKPKIKLPVFLSFVRQPFCASFRILGHPNTKPYDLMAVNAHLYFGNYIDDRRQEFNALMEWILARVKQEGKAYFPNFVLLGDLNLDFDNPERDRDRIEKHIKTFNQEMGDEVSVNFPFLDVHPKQQEVFRTNARMSETFDQIGLFTRDRRLPTYKDNPSMGSNSTGPDYGVFNFVELFSEALYGKPFKTLSQEEQKEFFPTFEHEVSDHLPLWLRLPLPVLADG